MFSIPLMVMTQIIKRCPYIPFFLHGCKSGSRLPGLFHGRASDLPLLSFDPCFAAARGAMNVSVVAYDPTGLPCGPGLALDASDPRTLPSLVPKTPLPRPLRVAEFRAPGRGKDSRRWVGATSRSRMRFRPHMATRIYWLEALFYDLSSHVPEMVRSTFLRR